MSLFGASLSPTLFGVGLPTPPKLPTEGLLFDNQGDCQNDGTQADYKPTSRLARHPTHDSTQHDSTQGNIMQLGLINSAWAQAGRDTAWGIRKTK